MQKVTNSEFLNSAPRAEAHLPDHSRNIDFRGPAIDHTNDRDNATASHSLDRLVERVAAGDIEDVVSAHTIGEL